MANRILLSALLASSIVCSSSYAQDTKAPVATNPKYLYKHQTIPHFYLGGALDGAIFSTATIHHDGVIYDPSGNNIPATNTMGIMRFTYFVNLGFTFNFNLTKNLGLYTGLDIKNVGYIEQDNGYTLKRRTYNVGIPAGIKIGNMDMKGSYFFLGGGIDAAINFQEKLFKDRDNKKRINEWFSDRTPRTMPYVFAGISFNHHITAKVQYYINNFMNTDYRDESGNNIYNGTEVHLILLSVGFGMNWQVSTGHKGNCNDCCDHCRH